MRERAVNLDRAANCAMRPGLAARYGELSARYAANPHGVTIYAEECRRAIQAAEERVLALAGATPEEAVLVWCASATEAANLALRGFPYRTRPPALVVDTGAHPALTATAAALGGTTACLPPADGCLPEVELAAFSVVNNENGAVWDGDRRAFPPRAALLLDASQAFGRHPLPWRTARPAMMILSGRKFGGPPWMAALVVGREIALQAATTGGGQQHGLRAGTLDTAGCVLFAEAAEAACRDMDASLRHVASLNRRLRDAIAQWGRGAWPVFSPEDASPYILYFGIPDHEGAIVARMLAEEYGILVGTGSACSAESGRPSALLLAQGYPEETARTAIRISFAADTAADDLARLLDALPRVLRDY